MVHELNLATDVWQRSERLRVQRARLMLGCVLQARDVLQSADLLCDRPLQLGWAG